MKNLVRLLFVVLACVQIAAAPAPVDGEGANLAIKTIASTMMKDMKVAIASDSNRFERRAAAFKLRQAVANLNPSEKLALIDELVATVDLAMNHQLASVKRFEMPNFIVAMSGLATLLTLHPERIVGGKMAAGLVLLGGSVYVQLEYLNPENIELHAAQLRSELLTLRRTIEMSQAAAKLN